MDKTFWTISLAISTVFSGIIALINHFNKPELYKKTKQEYRKKYRGRTIADILAFFIVYKTKLISAAIAAVSAIAFVLILVFVPPSDDSSSSVTAASPTPLVTPIPSIGPAEVQTNLEALTPLKKNPETAFFFKEWKALYPIKINDVEYEHSIGVRLPPDVIENFKENHDTEREGYKASIEYQLAFQYKKLRFNYGIDDSSFLEDGLCPPQCYFWIVVQSCDSENDLSEDQNVIFRTNALNYRRSLHSSGDIDVSGAEAIRITVYWEFDVIQSKPLAFNVAIINPILSPAES